jgi:hypothetical protein
MRHSKTLIVGAWVATLFLFGSIMKAAIDLVAFKEGNATLTIEKFVIIPTIGGIAALVLFVLSLAWMRIMNQRSKSIGDKNFVLPLGIWILNIVLFISLVGIVMARIIPPYEH